MSKRKDKPPSGGSQDGGASGDFDLGRPHDPFFQEMVAQPETASVALSGKIAEPGLNRSPGENEHKYKPMTWKGFEEEEPLDSMPFGKRAPQPEAEMDMTPMVDVTFLLLIFFMVTASFKLQKAIEQQPDLSDDPSNVVTEPVVQTDAIEIYIDENDNFTMTSSDAGEEQAAGKVEMWQKLAKMKQDSQGAKRLLIRANENCSHGAVVNAWDAGADAKIYEIAISVVTGP